MNTKTRFSEKEIAIVGLLAALIFIGTFYFKIPTAFGYTHLGDGFMILSVCLLKSKKGAIAGAIGAGLADLLGGYPVWVVPTMIFKASWAIVMGLIAFRLLANSKYNLWIGAFIGGLVHIALYTLIKIPLYGFTYAMGTLFTLSMQTLIGIIIGNSLYQLMKGKITTIISA